MNNMGKWQLANFPLDNMENSQKMKKNVKLQLDNMENWQEIVENTYTIFRLIWNMQNLYNSKTTEQKVFKFSVNIGYIRRFY